MEELLDQVMTDSRFRLTPTSRVIILYLARVPGARVEDIARRTGSRYRWVEATAMRLNRVGILTRVGPNAYALNPNPVVAR